MPNLGTAILAGGMLAFALSFDEVIVTTFTAGQQTTLPIWMLSELIRPRQRPITNVVAVFIICITFIPILYASYITRNTTEVEGSSIIQGGKMKTNLLINNKSVTRKYDVINPFNSEIIAVHCSIFN